MKTLSTPAAKAMDDYVSHQFADYLGDGEAWPLGDAWLAAKDGNERAHIAAAIVYQIDALADAPYRIIERGKNADERLCTVADHLGL